MTEIGKQGCQTRWTYAAHVFIIGMVLSLLVAISKDDLQWILECIAGIIISTAPILLKRFFKIGLPGIIDFMIAFALFLHVGMGGLFDVYYPIPDFDIVTHFVSSVLIAFLVLITIYLLNKHWDGLFIHVYAMAFAVVVVTMASGIVWEFAEWAADMLLGMNFQLCLEDTMMDLLVDTIGGTAMAMVGINLVKEGKLHEMTDDLGRLAVSYVNHKKKL